MTPRRNTRGIDKLAALLGTAVVLWLVSVVVVQTAYPLLPVQPSTAALRLEQEARQRPLVHENGFRSAGFAAPVGMDPLVFGHCMHPDAEKRAQQALAGKDLPFQSIAEDQTLVTRCLQGQSQFDIPKYSSEQRATRSWTLEDWLKLARTTPDPVLMERAETVWRHGHIRLGIDFYRPDGRQGALLWLAQWRLASAVGLWQDGRRDEALRIWSTSAEHALNATGDDLYETMISTSSLIRLLLSLQTSVRSSDTLDDASAARATQIVSMVDTLPEAVHRSLISEWQTSAHSLRSIDSNARTKWQTKREEQPGSQKNWAYLLTVFGLIYDPVDSVNLLSAHFASQRAAVLSAANGEQPAPVPPPTTCAWLGRFWHVCRPHERNPVGRWLARMSDDYIPHGTRIADLRNLAAATRLTIEARRRGLGGEALARFMTQAPDDMRDVFSHQPFSYDVQARELIIVLREKSSVLGEAGEYRLPL
jgi:hypothetical protein